MKKNFLAPVLVIALALSGCSVVGKAAGMVPQEDLDAATARVSELEGQLADKEAALAGAESDLEAANSQVTDLGGQLAGLEGTNEDLTVRNADLETLICPNRVWADFWSGAGFLRPEAWFDPSYVQAYLDMEEAWDFVPQMTQWEPAGDEWRTDLPGYLVVWDGQSMVWDVDEHCLILDPTLFRDLGK